MKVCEPQESSGGGGVLFADRRSPSSEHRPAWRRIASWLALDAFVIGTAWVLWLAGRSL